MGASVGEGHTSVKPGSRSRQKATHPDTAMVSTFLVVAVVALRPLRPRRAGGQSHYRPLSDEACAPLCTARRLAARAVPPKASLRSAGQARRLPYVGLTAIEASPADRTVWCPLPDAPGR